jgi:hypothetical protein
MNEEKGHPTFQKARENMKKLAGMNRVSSRIHTSQFTV